MVLHLYLVRKIIVYIFLILSFSSFAQKKTELVFQLLDAETLPKNIKTKSSFANREKAEIYLSTFIRNLHNSGYIAASIDSLVEKNDTLNAFLHLGEAYRLVILENGNLQNDVLKAVKFNEAQFTNRKFSFPEIQNLQKRVLSFYENKGFPFAEVYLDSFSISQNQVFAKIYAIPHQVFTIDTIIVEGNSKTKSKYLQNYLGIHKNDLYDHSKIKVIKSKLAQLSFVAEGKDAEVVFADGKTEVYIYLDKQKSNQFDLLLGIAPNSTLTKSKVNITGYGKLHLRNSFGAGEEIYLDFKQLKPRTQNLDVKFNYPFLLNLPFGVEGVFGLFKNDTAFLNLNSKAGFHYSFNGLDFIQLYYQNFTSNVLNYDTAKVNQLQKLPDVLDVSSNRFGVALHAQKLDYVLNPRKGFNLTVGGSFGLRKIRENAKLKEIKSDIYTDVKTNSINYALDFNLQYNIPILKRHSFLLENESKFFVSKNILQNEKYRIGGANSLRGFDEEAIYTPYYSLFTLEYHFLLSKNTYFYAFGDMAIVEDIRFGSGKIDTPYGFGVGAALETKGGIFSLSYALGKQLDNKLELKSGKIHFGYINLF